jgi:Glyoxalase-like domain
MGGMHSASFKDLCMDAGDALALGRFWASVLGATFSDQGDGSARVDPPPGRPAAERVWVDPVPEPRTVKTRVHVDLRLPGGDPAALVQAGASVVRELGADPWWVLADPEGNEFCAFPQRPDEPRPAGVFELCVDCRDALAQATWWAGVVGGKVERSAKGAFAWIEAAAGFPWQYWVFNEVPEPKAAKNRAHWDVDLTGSQPGDLVNAGAVVLREPDDDRVWWVLADPEGNEFCAFPPR